MAPGPTFYSYAVTILIIIHAVKSSLFNGCYLDNNLCESDEQCVPDNLLGECAVLVDDAIVLPQPPGALQTEILRLQFAKLGSDGYDLPDSRTQCFLIYFKLVLALELSYEPSFCDVNDPEIVLDLLKKIKTALFFRDDPTQYDYITAKEVEDYYLDKRMTDGAPFYMPNEVSRSFADINFIKGQPKNEEGNNDSSYKYDLETLEKLLRLGKQRSGEEEEEQSMNFVDNQAPVLKKDVEHLGNQDTGLQNIEHKIVKGAPAFQRVDGSRVYLKVAEGLQEEQLFPLIGYLDEKIAVPNNLIFNDFRLDGDQLSFHASKSNLARRDKEKIKRLHSAEGIAEAVYKRRKDIQTLSGVHVDETGIGSGEEAVPVESESRDQYLKPIVLVCIFTIATLFTVLIAHQVRDYQRRKREKRLLMTGEYDTKAPLSYQNLCRTRMANESVKEDTPHSKHSSTSSWYDEPISQPNIDVTTGHVILSFLREYIDVPSKIEEQWNSLKGYTNSAGTSSVADKDENRNKNRNVICLPYDDSLVSIQASPLDPFATTYINASAIHDSDPKQATYIATQSPLPSTITDFWQMIWEQGAVLLVNLANEIDRRNGFCVRYWPESGSHICGAYEIHLVSEHIWSEDYLVRSFYLKNLKANETRTVTQFHFLTWPKKGVPTTTKALLDFRRKVIKSYRGCAAPIVVHSTDGTGRTGTYILLDMVLNRVTRGIKELNVAGSLEHLRDQRRGAVETSEQYKMVFVCLAEEINAMVEALSK